MIISSPLYSNEFTYYCDNEDELTSVVFNINTTEQTVVHTHTINKITKKINDLNENKEVYKWDKENDSVWLTDYSDIFLNPPSLEIILLNFKLQKMFLQEMNNVLPDSLDFFKSNSPFRNETSDCYTLE
tara:strand:- start:1510 stop:1896 length:387 start_codon:yes stop_codon:yes gene_type:complete